MLEVKLERCAGIDVGKKYIDVCLLIGPVDHKPAEEVRRFGTTTRELEQCRAWLLEKGCTDVVMESTGSYWKPIFNILEGHVKVTLANPEHVKALRGKKTDRKDCRWLAGLMRHGLVQPSFIPPRDIRELRDLTRRRRVLLQNGGEERNRIQKILEDANIKIGSVLSDVFCMSGQAILESLMDNKLKPEEMAQFARGRARAKIPQLVEALEAHRKTDHHRLLIGQALRHMQFIEKMIEELDEQIRERLKPHQKQFELACTVPGIGPDSAAAILAEIGMDMSDDGPFASCHHLASWAGMCPGNNSSGGKQKNSRIRKGNRWLKATLCQTGWAAAATNGSSFQSRHRRIRARRGAQRANIAVGHAQLIALYWVLRLGVPYEKHHQNIPAEDRQSRIQHHLRRLAELGYQAH